MITIKLPHGVYQYDPNRPLGPKGGFGEVYLGQTANKGNVAIKHISIEAHREIRIADELLSEQHKFIIPIFDAGQDVDTGANYIVMAQAERSLQDYIGQKKVLTEEESISILAQIVQGLLEVPKLIHRDLKPGNILFHLGSWKIADFGIAKFVEESTSLQTLKGFLTPTYAAPEQWNYERPTNAVDVYALGCLAYELLTGTPPFTGTGEDLKDQHLYKQPPITKIVNPRLQTLIGMMLRKTPETRLSAERIKVILEQMKGQENNNSLVGLNALSMAASKVSEISAIEEAQKLSARSEEERRRKIAREAQEIISQIVDTLFQLIQNHAPIAVIHQSSKQFGNYSYFPNRSISLGDAELAFDFTRFSTIPLNTFERSGWEVYTGVIAMVTQKTGDPYIWSANLWYTNLGSGKVYRWWEIAYMVSPGMKTRLKYEPHAVEDPSEADIAASPGMAHIRFGSRPKTIDDENIDDFCNRWADLLARAANGQISYPQNLPLE